MKLLSWSPLWLVTAVVRPSSAITPFEAISSYEELSTLTEYISSSPDLTTLLSNANNFTLLAPSNDAFTAFGNKNDNLTSLLEATLQYSVLLGAVPSLSFTNESQFLSSNLNNATYTNVTGGQRVELVLRGDGTPQVITSNRSISTATSADIVCAGGIIHIINEVLTIPISTVLEVTAAGLEYFVSILNLGGFLSTSSSYVPAAMALTDITYFIPNSALALANATALFANSSPERRRAIFEYHIIPGVVAYSTDLMSGTRLKSTTGAEVTITIQNGETYVNAAKILAFDYIVANGVFHVIDNMLNQNDTSPPPPITSSISSTTASTQSTSSTSTSTSTAASTSTSNAVASSTSASSHTSFSTGAKAGIGVSSALGGLALIALLAIFLFRRHKRKTQHIDEVPNMGRFYIRRGTVQRQQEDLRLGLESANLRNSEPNSPGRRSKGLSYGSSSPRPSVPPRSPTRVAFGNHFF